MRKKLIIMGAAGRDFHNFNVLYKNDPSKEVVAFTAAQIPFIEERTYPAELAGKNYPNGIPIYPEEKLPELIKKHNVNTVVFSYSDVSHEYVMHRASLAASLGADFILPGAEGTMLKSVKPVISVCAVRTGSGKSGVTKLISGVIKKTGRNPIVIRHPMPYGRLIKEKIRRFSTTKDMKDAECTIEEMEEFEHLIADGIIVYAGVDYEEIVKSAEREGDVLIWDGGNNDTPFIKPDLEITVADALRAGDELLYYPGEVNLRRAGVVIINKVNTAEKKGIEAIKKNIKSLNPLATIVETDSIIEVEDGEKIRGKKALIIEDGPTLTHGGMSFGAGVVIAKKLSLIIVDPRPYAVGSIKEVFLKYAHLKQVLPAIGYREEQIRELETTINNTPSDIALIATPIDITKIMKINKPAVRVRYEVRDTVSPTIKEIVEEFLTGCGL